MSVNPESETLRATASLANSSTPTEMIKPIN
eukprot:CAMPEP_0116882908 /NCGR_PEP_ID=MMETSP0463-20121206/15308_1 /TAXON_ID=181622 /ORGANISM="Strombidinopsis sp, Strain SopsisLIS2011" /LENGTH=30 /DNA_ID= /DNA_START= /DNA_END= /DNA_ORIENTATION=